jgi:hypothetical protein
MSINHINFEPTWSSKYVASLQRSTCEEHDVRVCVCLAWRGADIECVCVCVSVCVRVRVSVCVTLEQHIANAVQQAEGEREPLGAHV